MKKILIVDDDRDLVLGLSIRLRAAGYGVLVARDGMAATSAAIEQSPDLILLDLGLPAEGGLVVLERLRQNGHTAFIPVIVLTGRDPAMAKDQVLALGAVAFCQKPVNNAELLALIRTQTGEGGAETRH